MTSAARPTFQPAQARSFQGGNRTKARSYQISARDQTAHTNLKVRKEGQNAPSEIEKKDLKAELLERERQHLLETGRLKPEHEPAPLAIEGPLTETVEDSSKEDEENEETTSKKRKRDFADIDADDTSESESSESESESDSESSESDEERELMRELERIKKERAEREQKQAAQKEEEAQLEEEEKILFSNPLLNHDLNDKVSMNVTKKWYQETTFGGQTRDEPKRKKRFINDTIRNDFHRKFLSKYVK